MSNFDEKEIIEVPLDRIGEDGQSSTKYCFTEMTAKLRITLTEAVKKYNDAFPEDATSQPNLANKLRRGGLKDYELARYAYALGYDLVLMPKEQRDIQISPDAIKNDKRMTVDRLMYYGIEIIFTNYYKVVIAGHGASAMAELITIMMDKHKDLFESQASELSVFNGLQNKFFDVIIKPVDFKE